MSDRTEPQFSTTFLLFAQYGGKAVIPIQDVCRDYFNHLTPEKFLRKVATGEIAIPVVRSEASQKCQKGIHLQDLATYIDQRRDAALKEFRQLTYQGPTSRSLRETEPRQVKNGEG